MYVKVKSDTIDAWCIRNSRIADNDQKLQRHNQIVTFGSRFVCTSRIPHALCGILMPMKALQSGAKTKATRGHRRLFSVVDQALEVRPDPYSPLHLANAGHAIQVTKDFVR